MRNLFEVQIFEVENGYVVSDRIGRSFDGARPAREWVATSIDDLSALIKRLAGEHVEDLKKVEVKP